MIVATSATVRNLTSLSEVASAAMNSPLPACCVRLARFGAPVTPVSSVSPVRKRATLPRSPMRGASISLRERRQFRAVTSPAAELAAPVPGRLDRGQERGPDAVPLQLADGVDRRAPGRGHRLAQDHRMLT